MPSLTIAPSLARWAESASGISRGEIRLEFPARTLEELLRAAYERFPHLKGYIQEETGTFRHHVVVFIDNQPLPDKTDRHAPLAPESEVYLFQALSGGAA